MKPLSKDARGFIEGVTNYIRSDARGKQVLPRVEALFTKVTNAAKKERVATVTSVMPLAESEKVSVQHVLARILGHDVECTFVLDSALIGGMKITVADWLVDTSLSSQLTTMAGELL